MIRHILFDLDCTLYSIHYGLEDKVADRMWQYVACFLGCSAEEAALERKKGIGKYGTTLEWLMAEKGFTAINDYMVKIHPDDEADCLHPDPDLRKFLEALPYPCSVLTNAPLFHADRVIAKLGLEGIFQRIFDIEGNEYKGKPHAKAFYRTLDALGQRSEEVLFVDDVRRYVEGYLAIGGRGILLDENDIHRDYGFERIGNLYDLVRFL